MSDKLVRYAAVYLRRQSDGGHTFAVDPGDGRIDYITLPAKVLPVQVGFGAKTKQQPQKCPFDFGDLVNITIEEPA